MPKEKESLKSTQSYLRIAEIKSNTMIMDDGTYAAVIAVSSTNFSLKSQEEQNALVSGYQTFLNSFDFPIQILMQSRKMDVHSYLESLNRMMEQQTNELLRVQTAEYIEFINKLIENASIMNKSFYIIVPFMPPFLKAAASGSGLLSFFKKKDAAVDAARLAESQKQFVQNRMQLEERINTVISGLSGLGLKSIPLQTDEIIELLYNSYNFDSGPLINAQKLSEIKIKN